MVQGLDTIQLAWNRIGDWSQRYVLKIAGDSKIFKRLQRSLRNRFTVIDALERDPKSYQTKIGLYAALKGRLKRSWWPRTLLIAGYSA